MSVDIVMNEAAQALQKKILIVEDDEVLSIILQEKLSRSGYGVTALPDGSALPYLLDRQCQRVDLLVMDIMLPGKDGIYWLKWLKQYHSYLPVIIISAKSHENERLLGLKNGADDYIVKPFNNEELLIRANKVLGRLQAFSAQQDLQINAFSLNVENKCLSKAGQTVPLTEMESKILQLLYLNAGKTVTRTEMVAQIWGSAHYDLTNRTIDAHIAKLRKKIEDSPGKPRYIRTIRGKGYCLHRPVIPEVDGVC